MFDIEHLSESDKQFVLECVDYIHMNELDYITETVLKSSDDILYNKKKFDSGEINLVFITGFSGSGKSTLAKGIKANVIDMDKIIMYHDRNDKFFENEPKVVRDFINGPGKKYRISVEERNKIGTTKFDKMVIDDLLIFVTSYANSHKSEKFIMDGAWIFLFIEPSKLKNYAVYIKGTGVFTSASRASKRGSNGNDTSSKLSKILYTVKSFTRVSVNAVSGKLQKYIKYYGPLYEEQISSN